jgi:uncharacterized membrane protein YuzA (DUF378 family)
MNGTGDSMIFGAMIIGVGIGLVAVVVAITAGANLLSAFLIYWLVGCAGTASVFLMKMLFCKDGRAHTPPTNQSRAWTL